MFYYFLGILSAVLVCLVLGQMKRRRIKIRWWGWLLSSLWLVYTLFVIAMTFTLIQESAGRAALVSFVIFGFLSAVTAVLLFRFAFRTAEVQNRSKTTKKKRS